MKPLTQFIGLALFAIAGATPAMASSQDQLYTDRPAANWHERHVTGLRARGGHEVDIYWKDRQPEKVVIRSEPGKSVAVRYGDSRAEVRIPENGRIELDGNLTVMAQ